jgi:hypothetical protein
MAKALFVVRAMVIPPLRQKFDRWYSSHRLPMALDAFNAEKCWRFWSVGDAGVHYAVYQFTDLERLLAALDADSFNDLIADFDAAWPSGVSRRHDVLSLVEEKSG